MITVPPKIWRRKAATKYIPLPPRPDAGSENYMHTQLGYVLKKLPSMSNTPRDDIIAWDYIAHSKELTDNLWIDNHTPPRISDIVISLRKKYWDAFNEDEIS